MNIYDMLLNGELDKVNDIIKSFNITDFTAKELLNMVGDYYYTLDEDGNEMEGAISDINVTDSCFTIYFTYEYDDFDVDEDGYYAVKCTAYAEDIFDRFGLLTIVR